MGKGRGSKRRRKKIKRDDEQARCQVSQVLAFRGVLSFAAGWPIA